MKIKSKFILIAIIIISLTGCFGAFVPVIDLANVDPQVLQASQNIQTYIKGKNPPLGYREIGPVKRGVVRIKLGIHQLQKKMLSSN